MKVNGDDERLEIPFTQGNDGAWHYFTASRYGSLLAVTVDDKVRKTSEVGDVGEFLPSQNLQIQLGKNEDGLSFVGCIADLAWNGKMTNFASVSPYCV